MNIVSDEILILCIFKDMEGGNIKHIAAIGKHGVGALREKCSSAFSSHLPVQNDASISPLKDNELQY